MSPETPQTVETPKILTEEELKAQNEAQKKLFEDYVAKIRAKIEYQKKVLANKYHAKKKNRAAMKKKSQKINRQNDKNYLKRKAKRDAKAQLKKK